jgi:CHASE1-domain containing sensor protein
MDVAMDKPLDDVARAPVSWRALALGAAVFSLTALFMAASVWFIKRESQRNFSARSSRFTQWAQTKTQEAMDQHVKGLTTLAQTLAGSAAVDKNEFKDRAADVLRQDRAFAALNYINGNFVVEEVYPYAGNRMALGLDLKSRFDVLPVAHRAITTHDPAVTELIDLVQGGKGILVYAPVYRDDRWSGFVEGAFKITDFTSAFLDPQLGDEYNFTIIDESNGHEVFTSLLPTAYERSTPFDTYFTLRIADRTWWIILHPKSPPMVLLPMVFVLLLELCLGALIFYWLWKRGEGAPAFDLAPKE